MKKTYIDLILHTGDIVRIEVPEKFEDEAFETLESAMKRRDWWSVRQFDGAHAKLLGHYIDCVNMGNVVARL